VRVWFKCGALLIAVDGIRKEMEAEMMDDDEMRFNLVRAMHALERERERSRMIIMEHISYM
jgi:hypothetical protein